MVIGSFGDVVFSVSDRQARTFDEFLHTVTARLAVHEPVCSEPRTEFLGPGQGEITFLMQLSAALGVDPRGEVEKLQVMTAEGLHAPLILAGRPVGGGEWIIESVEAELRQVSGAGKVGFVEATVTIKEYF